jgi:hypothetical protein
MELTIHKGASLNRNHSPDTTMAALLDTLRGFVLLGGPGAGKSMLMAELTRDLVDRAESDSSFSVPLAASLARWAKLQGDIDHWISVELSGAALPEVVLGWIRNSQVNLLLDGLDEVPLENRVACATAINRFRELYPSIPVVVSCRMEDYEQLPVKLNLHGAVVVQPLTREAIDSTVERAGKELNGLRTALDIAPQLYEVIASPLMLDIARIVFEAPDLKISSDTSPDDIQRRLLDEFVNRMLDYRYTPGRLEVHRIRKTLHWIASNMRQFGHLYFWPDSLTSIAWLPDSGKLFALLAGSLVVGGWTCFRLSTIFGALGFALGRSGAHWLALGLGTLGALIGLSLGTSFTTRALGINWEVSQVMFGKVGYYDQMQRNQFAFDEYLNSLDPHSRFKSIMLIRLMRRLDHDGGLLLSWIFKLPYVALFVFCTLFFPIGAIIGLIVGPPLSFIFMLIVIISARRNASQTIHQGSVDSQVSATSSTGENSGQNAPQHGSVTGTSPTDSRRKWSRGFHRANFSNMVISNLMDPVVRTVLWINGTAPFNHDRLLRGGVDRVLLRRSKLSAPFKLDDATYAFVHPVFIEYFAARMEAPNASGGNMTSGLD